MKRRIQEVLDDEIRGYPVYDKWNLFKKLKETKGLILLSFESQVELVLIGKTLETVDLSYLEASTDKGGIALFGFNSKGQIFFGTQLNGAGTEYPHVIISEEHIAVFPTNTTDPWCFS